MVIYRPTAITSRKVTNADGNPYVPHLGAVTTYDPNGGINFKFPDNASGGDTVELKNSTRYTDPATVAAPDAPAGQLLELPGTTDTDVLVSSVTLNKPLASYRWVFDGTNTWYVDKDYSQDEPQAKTTQVSATQSPYTLQRNGEIILADTSLGPVTITVPEGWADDSKFSVTKITDDGNIVTIQRSGSEQLHHPRFNSYVDSFALLYAGENVSYVLKTAIWYPNSIWLEPYTEIFSVPVNTDIPLVSAPMPMTFAGNSLGESSSRLWTDAGGVLTAIIHAPMSVEIQATMWFDLTANNSAMYATLAPATNAATAIFSPLRAGLGASRQIYVPQSVMGVFALDADVGNTFQVNMQQVIEEGSGDADLGDDTATPADTWGALVTFTVN